MKLFSKVKESSKQTPYRMYSTMVISLMFKLRHWLCEAVSQAYLSQSVPKGHLSGDVLAPKLSDKEGRRVKIPSP